MEEEEEGGWGLRDIHDLNNPFELLGGKDEEEN